MMSYLRFLSVFSFLITGIYCLGKTPITDAQFRVNVGLSFDILDKDVYAVGDFIPTVFNVELFLHPLPPKLEHPYEQCRKNNSACSTIFSQLQFAIKGANIHHDTLVALRKRVTDQLRHFTPLLRGKRDAPLSFIGSLSSTLFGTASTEQLNEVRQLVLKNFENLKSIGDRDASLHEYLTNVTTGMDDRIVNVWTALNTTMETMENVFDSFREGNDRIDKLTDSVDSIEISSSMAYHMMLVNLHMFSQKQLESEYQNTLESLNILKNGKLPRHLVSDIDLNKALLK